MQLEWYLLIQPRTGSLREIFARDHNIWRRRGFQTRHLFKMSRNPSIANTRTSVHTKMDENMDTGASSLYRLHLRTRRWRIFAHQLYSERIYIATLVTYVLQSVLSASWIMVYSRRHCIFSIFNVFSNISEDIFRRHSSSALQNIVSSCKFALSAVEVQ